MTGRRSYWIRLLALAVFAALPMSVHAGTTGALSGTVLSQDGAPLPGAHVTVAGAPATLTTLSDDRGHFAFVSLAPYVYIVTVSAQGREPASLTGVNVIADNTQFVTIVMHTVLKTLAT